MQMEHGSGNSGRKPSWLTGRGILIAVMFLLGLGIFLYPHICDWYYQYQFNKAIAAYDRFQGIDCEGMIQAAREYNERLEKKEERKSGRFSRAPVSGMGQACRWAVKIPIVCWPPITVL